MNSSFLVNPERKGPLGTIGGGVDRNKRVDPSPNESGSAFQSNDIANDTFLNRETMNPIDLSRQFGDYRWPDGNFNTGETNRSLSIGKTARLGTSGDPMESGLFEGDSLEPRPPGSLAWDNNSRRVGIGPLGSALIDKEFNDMSKLTDSHGVMDIDAGVPDEKTAWYRAGRDCAGRLLRWR